MVTMSQTFFLLVKPAHTRDECTRVPSDFKQCLGDLPSDVRMSCETVVSI